MVSIGISNCIGFGSTYVLQHRNPGYRQLNLNINTTNIGTSISGTIRTELGHFDFDDPATEEPIKYIGDFPNYKSYTIAAPGTEYDDTIEDVLSDHATGTIGGGIIYEKEPYNQNSLPSSYRDSNK